ncbi:MAG: DUF1015 family protein, partial [Pedosphaera sp.]|nr:DUF1015 family protein [Pedosphaera sp.]
PHDQIQILAYNRAVRDLNRLDAAQFLSQLDDVFDMVENQNGECAAKNELGLYLDGKWRRLVFKAENMESETAADGLDVALLQHHVLGPILRSNDPRTSDRIDCIGGIRGLSELERLVDSGEYACAFSMFPTRIEDLMEIANAGGLMPPKSTWFEPKLRDGMFCHMI